MEQIPGRGENKANPIVTWSAGHTEGPRFHVHYKCSYFYINELSYVNMNRYSLHTAWNITFSFSASQGKNLAFLGILIHSYCNIIYSIQQWGNLYVAFKRFLSVLWYAKWTITIATSVGGKQNDTLYWNLTHNNKIS